MSKFVRTFFRSMWQRCQIVLIGLAVVFGFNPPAPAQITTTIVVFVKANAPAGGNGQSWATAYRYFQDGIKYAKDQVEADISEHTAANIWVAQGIYRPDQAETYSITLNDPSVSFRLHNR